MLYLDLTWARIGQRTSETISLSPTWPKTGRRILRPGPKQVGDSPSPTCLRRLMRSLCLARAAPAANGPLGMAGWAMSWGNSFLVQKNVRTWKLRGRRPDCSCQLAVVPTPTSTLIPTCDKTALAEYNLAQSLPRVARLAVMGRGRVYPIGALSESPHSTLPGLGR